MPLNKPTTIDLNAFGALITATIIPAFDLDAEGQIFINGELTWLFSAADNLMKVILKEADRDQPVAVPIPPEAQKLPQANNQLLKIPNDPRYMESEGFEVMLRGKSSVVKGGWHRDLDSLYNRINTRLKSLNLLLGREASLGEAGKSDIYLQVQIKELRLGIVKDLQDLAELMNNAYGIKVTGPDQLIEFLG